jgi:hypothetical protein
MCVTRTTPSKDKNLKERVMFDFLSNQADDIFFTFVVWCSDAMVLWQDDGQTNDE